MNADLLTLFGKILLAALTLFGSALGYAWGYIKLRDRRIRAEVGLEANPKSCEDHEKRLREIEKTLAKVNTNIVLIKYKLGMPEDSE
jgi:hypothetical protein